MGWLHRGGIVISVLLEGALIKDPVSRTASNGNPYTTATMRCADADGESILCSVRAFNAEVAQTLARLSNGDTVAVAGHAAISQWDKDGQHHVGLSVTATRVLTVYDAGQRRKVQHSEVA